MRTLGALGVFAVSLCDQVVRTSLSGANLPPGADLGGVDAEFACYLSDLVSFQCAETAVGSGDRGQKGSNRLALRSIEPRPKSSADGVCDPAIGELGPVAGDFSDQHRMLGGNSRMFDEDLLHLVALVVAHPAIGQGDPHQDKGKRVEVVGSLRGQRVERLDGLANHHCRQLVTGVLVCVNGRWVLCPLLLCNTQLSGRELQ